MLSQYREHAMGEGKPYGAGLSSLWEAIAAIWFSIYAIALGRRIENLINGMVER